MEAKKTFIDSVEHRMLAINDRDGAVWHVSVTYPTAYYGQQDTESVILRHASGQPEIKLSREAFGQIVVGVYAGKHGNLPGGSKK
jgi:hypothetical protein